MSDVEAPIDTALDTPLPCDVRIGPVVLRAGEPLRELVLRAQILFDAAVAASGGKPAIEIKLADMQAQIGLAVLALDLDQDRMARRTADVMRPSILALKRNKAVA